MKKITILLLAFGFINGLFAQDKLIGFGNETKNVKVIQITDKEISYKAFENLNGPLYTVPKDQVVCIVYENGVVEVFQQKPKSYEEIINEYKQNKRIARKQNIDFRNSIGQDVFALIPGLSDYNVRMGVSSFGFNFERRSPKQYIAHKIGLNFLYTNESRGSFYFNYSPKIFFNKHKIIRGFAGPEVALGYYTFRNQYYYYDEFNNIGYEYYGKRQHLLYSHLGTTVGMNIYPTERMHIIFDLALGAKIMNAAAFNTPYSPNYYSYYQYDPFFWRLGMTIGFNFGKK